MQNAVDIEKLIKLANSKTTTVQDVFETIYATVQKFTVEREEYYLDELKSKHKKGLTNARMDAGDHAAHIYECIESDICDFVQRYTDEAIDGVLDAKNEKRITSKLAVTNMLTMLASLKEAYKK